MPNPAPARAERASVLGTSAAVARSGLGLLLYLSPVILLSTVFPLVSPEIGRASIGGVGLSLVVLASSLTVPWLSQVGCLPVYRSIGDLIDAKNPAAITKRFNEYWAKTLVMCLPAVAVFTAAVWLLLRWSPAALLAYAILTLLHLAFVQSLVVGNVLQRKPVWALAWAAYAAALLVAPTLWFLPPVLGTLTQVAFMFRSLPHLRAMKSMDLGAVVADMGRGFLLGSVLWADKLVLFLVSGARIDVVAVFMALMPATIAYNCYFVFLAPRVDRAAARLRTAIHDEPYEEMSGRAGLLFGTVEGAIRTTMLMGVLLSVPMVFLMEAVVPGSFGLFLSVLVASWLFMMVTLLTYQLDYIGVKRTAQWICAVHLVVCVLALSIAPGIGGYLALIVCDAVLFAVSYLCYRRAWIQPEYTLFWRQAVSW